MTPGHKISDQIWNEKYRLKHPDGTPIDQSQEGTQRRIARALAQAEAPDQRQQWEERFFSALQNWAFLPAGRIIAGAGTGERNVTLFNCFRGDTKFYTKEFGLATLESLAGQTVTTLGKTGWSTAHIHAHGVQPLNKITLVPARVNNFKNGYTKLRSNIQHEIYATPNHRWILPDGQETTQLRVGQTISRCYAKADKSSETYRNGMRHGLVFGDGTRLASATKKLFTIVLCNTRKQEYAELFAEIGAKRYDCPSRHGMPQFTFETELNLKAVPPEGLHDDYYAGFIDGWLAADGHVCKRDGTTMLTSQNASAIEWVLMYAPLGGWVVSGHRLDPSLATAYGPRSDRLHFVAMSKSVHWKVAKIEPSEAAPVYCPEVQGEGAFTLSGGVFTGNCFVMGQIPDSMDGIFSALREAALTMQQGGGIGYDFSTIRPKGAPVVGVAADASGPLSFMDVWDAMCRTLLAAGARRGAMMATMRCDHPDVLDFITAKRDITRNPRRLSMFNLSVLCTDAFMQAVEAGAQWDLVFNGRVFRTVAAQDLWAEIMRNTYASADPGVIFIDRINGQNNLKYCEQIYSTNPCVTSDTWVMTSEGRQQVHQLLGKPFIALVHGVKYPSGPDGFFWMGVKPTYTIHTKQGYTLTATADHKIMSSTKGFEEWKTVRDLKQGDEVVIHSHGANDPKGQTAEISFTVSAGFADVYDCQIPGINAFDANGMYVHNCGEQPLPPYGACLLGSVNLTQMLEPCGTGINYQKLSSVVSLAVRMMDNVVDVSKFALEAQEREAKAKRRIGLGITGLGSMLAVMGLRYGSVGAQEMLRAIMDHISVEAYKTSTELAEEKGAFPLYTPEYLESPFIQKLPGGIQQAIARHGIRNSHLTSIAPTGTISLLAGNVSSGIEPIFAPRYTRKILQSDGTHRTEEVKDWAVAKHEDHAGPEPLVTDISHLTPLDHLTMQAIAQRFVDSAISKTVNLSEEISFEDFQEVYKVAYALGCKGCTTYRPNDVTGSVLEVKPEVKVHIPAEALQVLLDGEKVSEEMNRADNPPVNTQVKLTEAQYDVIRQTMFYQRLAEGQRRMEINRQELNSAWPPNATLTDEPRARPSVLSGATYKLRWGETAIYLTINSSAGSPFEIFLQSKDISHQAWTQALTRMISAVYRRGGNVEFVAKELQEIYDPKGGNWIDGKYVVSLPALIGQTVEQHFAKETPAAAPASASPLGQCPKCHQHTLVHESGCETCHSCHYSRC